MSLFGTDGIRGVANREPMTSETVTRVGRAIAFVAKKKGGRARILIGKDTRLSGYMIETALATGICSMGVDVLLIGPLPTAAVAWLTTVMKADRGVAVTASHNPYRDNGIKVFGAEGRKLSEREEQEISDLVIHHDLDTLRPIEEAVGKAYRVDEARESYVEFLRQSFPGSLKNLKLVVDCAHGATYYVAPRLFERLGATVIPIGVEPDGTNINGGCGSEHPELLCQTVLKEKADAGIAVDGDGDRCVMVDEKGAVLDGDHLLAMVALDRLKQGRLPRSRVVLTEMSNTGLIRYLEKHGIEVEQVPVGDRHIAEALRRGHLSLGGEQSGHLLFPDIVVAVDGLATALQVLAASPGEKLSVAAHRFQPWPQLLKNIPVREKRPLESFPNFLTQIDECRRELDHRGRIVVRYSGTESLLRVMLECEERNRLEPLAKEIQSIISSAQITK